MSWWVYLNDSDGQTVEVTSHSEGGTYVVGGTPEASLNITYNYSKHFHDALISRADPMLSGLDVLDGQRALDVTYELEQAVETLGTERDHNYWAATEGNAGYALAILLEWARQHPSAVFEVH